MKNNIDWQYIWNEKKKKIFTEEYINLMKDEIGINYEHPLFYNGSLDGNEANKNKQTTNITKTRCAVVLVAGSS